MSVIRRGILAARCGPPDITDGVLIRQAFRFPLEFAGFSGHFPSEPILPAVVQIGMGILLVELLLESDAKDKLVLEFVRQAKFVRKLQPCQAIMAQCRRRGPDERSFDIALTVDQAPASSFTLNFASQHNGLPDA